MTGVPISSARTGRQRFAGLSDDDLMASLRCDVRACRDHAIAELVARHQKYAVRLARAFLIDPSEADDVVVEAFCRLHNKHEAYEPRAERRRGLLSRWLSKPAPPGLRSFLSGFVDYCALEANRRTRRRYKREIDLSKAKPDALVDSRPTGEGRAIDRERLNMAIDRLPRKLRRVALCLSLGMSREEIARENGISVGTAGRRIRKARERILKLLASILPKQKKEKS